MFTSLLSMSQKTFWSLRKLMPLGCPKKEIHPTINETKKKIYKDLNQTNCIIGTLINKKTEKFKHLISIK